jgi:hypothetical protein
MKKIYNRLISSLSMVKIMVTLSFTLFFEITNSQELYTSPDTTEKSINPIRADKAKSVAVNYMRLLAKGENIDSILALCSVPFSWDRKEIISEQAALKQKHIDIIAKKGKNRAFFVDTAFIKATRKEMLDNIIPLDVYYVMIRIKQTSDPNGKVYDILFAVQMSDNPKITGISD